MAERQDSNEARMSLADAVDAFETFVLRLINPLCYPLRNALKFKRRGYRESPETPPALPEALAGKMHSHRAQELEQCYGLETFADRLSPQTLLYTLFYLELLEQVDRTAKLRAVLPKALRVLDIGAKNFDTALALDRFLREGSTRSLALTGVEIDAWRIYRNWHSRYDAAQYYLSLLDGRDAHRYLAEDFLRHEGEYNLIFWLRPFLDDYPLLHWGLPRRMLSPEAMFRHMLDCLAPGGWCVIMNPTREESDVQRELITQWHQGESMTFEYVPYFQPHDDPVFLHLLEKAP